MPSPYTIWNLLFTSNRNSRSSVTLTVVAEFPSFCFCFILCRKILGSFCSFFSEWSCMILNCIKDNNNLVWIKRLSDSPTYLCSAFSLYFLVKGFITSCSLTCNNYSCFNIDSKSLQRNSLLNCRNLIEVRAGVWRSFFKENPLLMLWILLYLWSWKYINFLEWMRIMNVKFGT